MGIDLGEARVGIAVSDELGMFAHPRETIHLPARTPGRDQALLKRVKALIEQERIAVVVIEAIRAGTACEVRLIDERLTTVAAQRALHEGGRNVKQGRAVIDQVAAQMILQTYLDGEALRPDEEQTN
jgi:putative Holliday junction resolvase